jgi:hypothetical protein
MKLFIQDQTTANAIEKGLIKVGYFTKAQD